MEVSADVERVLGLALSEQAARDSALAEFARNVFRGRALSRSRQAVNEDESGSMQDRCSRPPAYTPFIASPLVAEVSLELRFLAANESIHQWEGQRRADSAVGDPK